MSNKEEAYDIFKNAAKLKSIVKIDYNDIDKIVNAFFGTGFEYESVAYQEWGNYQSHEFSIKKEKIDEYDWKKIESALEGEFQHYSLRTILIHLCNEDVIPEGDYVIQVYW